jgi:hypothetical protein
MIKEFVDEGRKNSHFSWSRAPPILFYIYVLVLIFKNFNSQKGKE